MKMSCRQIDIRMLSPARSCASWLIVGLLCMNGFGQQLVVPANSRDTELEIPLGAQPLPGKGKTLLVRMTSGKTHVALLNCTVGDKCLVTLPSGQVSMVARAHAKPTDKPFKASGKAMKESIQQAGLADFKVASAKPYIFVYGCSKAFYLHTRSILETMYPGVVTHLKSWGLPVSNPKFPLLILIMPDRATFDKYRPTPREVAAYYNGLTNQIVLYEDQALAELAPEYALKQASYVIAHEGVHQLLANTGIQKRLSRWPMWISEGLPEYFCPLKVSSKVVRKGLAQMPVRSIKWTKAGMVNDLRMHELLRVAPANPGEAIKYISHAPSLNSTGYSLSWGMVHYLVNHRFKEFQAYLKELSQLGSLEVRTGDADPFFVKHFGDDYAGMEKAIQGHLTSSQMEKEYVDPIANQTHYVVKRIAKKGKAFGIALFTTTSPGAARKWKELQEKQFKRAQFYSFVCKNEKEARYQIEKIGRKR